MRSIYRLLPVLFFATLAITACSKKDKTNVDTNSQQQNQDVSDTKSESDNINSDVNTAVSNNSSFGKNSAATAITICGATVNTVSNATYPTITIDYDNATTCSDRIRSGQIKIELVSGAHWSDAGAQLRVTHTNYKVVFTDLGDHSITFNGVKYLTDVNGINWLSLLAGTDTAVLRERCYGLQVAFDNGQNATWNSARLTKYFFNSLNIYAVVNGDTTINNKVTDSWGVTRFNTNFTTTMTQPWASNSLCGWWRPTQGIYTCATDSFSITATLGTNSGGTQIGSGCAAYYKLQWNVNSGANGSAVLPYY